MKTRDRDYVYKYMNMQTCTYHHRTQKIAPANQA